MIYDPASETALAADPFDVAQAAGVLALVTRRAATSQLLRTQLQTAYDRWTTVLGVRMDAGAKPPTNLAEHGVVENAPHALVDTVHGWCRQQRDAAVRPWYSRLWHTLVADRDTRG